MSLSRFYQRCVDRGASDRVGCINTNEALAYAVTDESCGDVTCPDMLMDHVMAAGAYDSKAVRRKYSDMGIEMVMNIRSSQLGKYGGDRYKGKSYGCVERGSRIKRIKMIGKDQWKVEMGYGRRWKVECTFSDLKRLFGDILRARTRGCDVLETVRKVMVLNIYKDCRRQAIGA